MHEVEQVCTTMAIINLGKLIKIGGVTELLKSSDTFITEVHAKPIKKAINVLKVNYPTSQRYRVAIIL